LIELEEKEIGKLIAEDDFRAFVDEYFLSQY
jgi:hypothetical protein